MTKIKITSAQLEINPETAKKYLETSEGNRKMDNSQLNKLVKIILSGKWLVQPSGISFDYNGVLIDGHTRLNAIVKADKTVEMLVQHGFDPKVRSSIDTGKSKTVSNGLEMIKLGLRGENKKGEPISYARQISQLATYIILYQQNNTSVCNGRGGLTNAEIIDFVQANENELIDSIIKTKEVLNKSPYMNENYFSFLYQINKFVDEAKILQFMNIVSGSEVSDNPNCPAMALKNLLIKNKTKKEKLRTILVFGYVVDACNKFMNNESGKLTPTEKTTKGEVKLRLSGDVSINGELFFSAVPQIIN